MVYDRPRCCTPKRVPTQRTSPSPDGSSFQTLSQEFVTLLEHLAPLRLDVPAGLTQLRSRLDRLALAALAADNKGRYLVVNRAAAALTGHAASELETMSVWDLTPLADAHTGERLWFEFMAAGEQRGTYSVKGKHQTIDGVYYLARAHVLPGVHVSLLHKSS